MQGDRTYEVGYGKPPVHSRFRPGVSGNPRGRPVGSENAATFAKNLAALVDQEWEEEEAIMAGREYPPKSRRRRRKRS